jgi:hypothetical protein
MRKEPMEIGTKIYKLTLLEYDEPVYDGFKKIKRGVFECECGRIKTIMIHNIKSGGTKSCGCNYFSRDRTGMKK